jgi:aspartyl-tRNA(Asn)/glutamyl-tRNA(Gln) amidotransferase subunit B
VLAEMFKTGKGAQAVIEEQGLEQLSDAGEIEKIVTDVLASNPQQLAAYRGGKEALFGFVVGQVLKVSKGKANPKVVNELLKEKLKAE